MAQAPCGRGALEDGVSQAARPSDDEGEGLSDGEPGIEPVGEGLAGPHRPLTREGDDRGAGREPLPKAVSLAAPLLCFGEPGCLADLDFVDGCIASQAAAVVVTRLAVIRAQLPHRYDGESHQA